MTYLIRCDLCGEEEVIFQMSLTPLMRRTWIISDDWTICPKCVKKVKKIINRELR